MYNERNKKGVIGLENYLGRKLKEYREQHLLTRKQLGDILCVSDKTISKWERGAGLPDIGTLKHLSQLLQIPLDDLLNEKEAPFIMNTKVNGWLAGCQSCILFGPIGWRFGVIIGLTRKEILCFDC